jgi:tRNA threonylcarbamoyladenosine biosynthesis protein TsaB
VDTFAAIALQTPAEARRLAVLEDAQQNKVYVQHFVRSQPGAAWQPATPLSVQNLADWLAALERDRWVTGPGLRVAGKRLPEGTPIVDVGQWDPRPESLLRLGLARYRAGQRDDVWALEPLYLRPSSAEEKWQERHGG